MNKIIKQFTSLSLVILFCGGLWTCMKPKIYDLDFYSVSMVDPYSNVGFGTVTLVGNVDVNAVDKLVGQGFVISENESDIANNTGDEVSAIVDSDGTFSLEWVELPFDKNYFMKAYAVFEDDRINGQRKVYSETVMPFSFSVMVTISTSIEVENDIACVSGNVFGLQLLGISADDHGFIYSSDDSAPLVLNDGVSSVMSLGLLNDDSTFLAKLIDLDLNTSYRVRSYAATADIEYYSDVIRNFETVDGWKLLQSNGFEMCDGFGLGVDDAGTDKAYFFGCTNCLVPDNCENSSLAQDMFEFDPIQNNNAGTWTNSGSGFQNIARRSAIAFQIGDTLYFGTGKSGFLTGDMQKIATADIGQVNTANLSSSLPKREGAISFVLNGKAYVGTGRNSLNPSELINDFWEYNPETGNWREVASLPRKASETSPIDYDGGRREAISFVLGNLAYVGGGVEDNNEDLRDFWVFQTPSGPNDMGAWSLLDEFFVGAGRVDGVSFTLQGKGYFGTGNDFNNQGVDGGYLNDFWSFDPSATPMFQERTSLPDVKRTRGLGFALGDHGYLGYGQRIIVNGNMTLTVEALHDLWKYYP